MSQMRAAKPVGTLVIVAVLLVASAAALFTGVVAGLEARLLLAPVFAVGGAIAVMVVRVRLLVWTLCVVSLFVVGPLIYFGGFEAVRWLSPALSFALAVPLIMHVLGGRPSIVMSEPQSGIIRVYWLFLLLLVFSTLLSEPRMAEVVFASRMYLAYLPLALVLSAGMLTATDLWQLWKFMLWAAVIQAPVALYQALVVAPGRDFQLATWDAVVGTFPGNPEIGGANAGMSIFCLIAALVALSLRKGGHISRVFQWLVIGSALITIATGEVKAVVLMIPVIVAIFYLPEIARKPVRSLAWMGAGVILAVALMGAYNRFYYQDRDTLAADRSPATAQESIANQFDPRLAQRGYIMGRVAGFYDWGLRHGRGEQMPYALIGHGAGALQIGRIGVGEIAEKLSYRADNTATGLLLWESGMLGHGLIVVFMSAAAVTAFRLRKADGVPPEHQAICYAVCSGFVLHILCLPYKDFMFRAAPSQVFLFFMVGYVAYWSRVSRAHRLAERRHIIQDRVR